MKNNYIVKITFLILILLAYSLANAEEEKSHKFKIGAILPLSGGASSLGNYLKHGLDLAYDNLTKEQRSKIELIYEDDQLKAQKSVSAYKKLRSTKQIDAVFVLGSGIGNAIAPIAEKDKVLHVAIGASDGSIAKNKKYSFLHWVTPETEAKALSEEIQLKGYKKIGIITTEHEGAIAFLNAVKESFKKNELSKSVVSEQSFLPEVTDFRTGIAKLKTYEPDAVIVILFPGAISSFAKQSAILHLGADLIGAELFEDENEVKASEGALIGHWYVTADISSGEFLHMYKERYSAFPGWAAANAFDTLNLVADAVKAHGVSTEMVAKQLASLKNYTGAAGVYSATGDNRFTLPATVKVVTEDGFEKIHK